MDDSCPICFDEYTKRSPPLVCQYCPAAACQPCHRTHILSNSDDPSCYACRRAWGTEFITASFTNSFRIGPLKKHRAKLLVDREKALLPAAQAYVEYKKNAAMYYNEVHERNTKLYAPDGIWDMLKASRLEGSILHSRVETCRENIKQIKREIKTIGTIAPSTLEILEKSLAEQRKQRDEYKAREAKNLEHCNILQEHSMAAINLIDIARQQQMYYDNLYHDTANGQVQERREFIMKCPDGDCRGFLSTAYKCGTCAKWACPSCLVVLGEKKDVEHTCDQNLVESTKLIRSETRPCPKCAAPIFKIDGCDQMFCVVEKCGTAFSWNTGHIVSGVIHNPHYYEWLRRTGGAIEREVGDIPCGGMPETWRFVRLFTREVRGGAEFSNPIVKYMLESFRNMNELITHRLPMYPARKPQMMNKDDDVDYLMNVITEDVWKAKLQRSDAQFLRKKEIGQILQTMATTFSDRMNTVHRRIRDYKLGDSEEDTLVTLENWLHKTVIPELEQLRAFGNESFLNLSKRDKMAVPQFEYLWKWKPARILHRVKKVKDTVEANAEANAEATAEANAV